MHAVADSMHAVADSMHAVADSMHAVADSMQYLKEKAFRNRLLNVKLEKEEGAEK